MTTTLAALHDEIERLSAIRSDLYRTLADGFDPEVVRRIKQLDAELDGLWHEHRTERARIRFGGRDAIVKRARTEERLERAA
jgi:hypothetical protein